MRSKPEWHMVYIRKEVADFAEAMERKLQQRDDRGHWLDEGLDKLWDGFLSEVDELCDEVAFGSDFWEPSGTRIGEGTEGEAVDVANYALFLWDMARTKGHGHTEGM